MTRLVGTAPGQGYGVHVHGSDDPVGLTIQGNVVRRAQRSSIYVAGGIGALVAGNWLLDHRADIGGGTLHPAMTIGRSSDVTVKGNYFHNTFGGGLRVGTDTEDEAENMILARNLFIAAADNSPDLLVGVPGHSSPRDVQVQGNIVSRKTAVNGAFRIYNALSLDVSYNRIRVLSAAGATAVDIDAAGDTGGTADFNDDLSFTHNRINMGGGGSHRGFRITNLGQSIANAEFDSNVARGVAAMFAANANVTNPNITVRGQRIDGAYWDTGPLRPAFGDPVQLLPNVATPAAPSGGGVLFVQGGALKYRGSSGTVTTLGPA